MTADRIAESRINPSLFRNVLGHYPTGVCVVTGMDVDGRPVGMTVGSFTSVSLDPPLVAFFPMAGSSSYAQIRSTGNFCVNVLSRDQEALCRRFATAGSEKFHGVEWGLSPLGSPVLENALAWVDCRIVSTTDTGDHVLVLGEVEHLSVGTLAPPLMFFRGGYGGFTPQSLVAGTETGLTEGLRLAELARPHLESLAGVVGFEVHATAIVDDEVVQLAWVPSRDRSRFSTSKVGLRLPLVPPMDIIFVAWADVALQERWLAERAADFGDEFGDFFRGVLDRVRAQGAIATPYDESRLEVERTVTEIAGSGTSPALRERLIRQLKLYARRFPESWESVGEPIGAISAPVFESTGHVAMTVTVQGDPEIGTVTTDECLAPLLRVCRDLSELLGGSEFVPGTSADLVVSTVG